jgi:hypothetical protein
MTRGETRVYAPLTREADRYQRHARRSAAQHPTVSTSQRRKPCGAAAPAAHPQNTVSARTSWISADRPFLFTRHVTPNSNGSGSGSDGNRQPGHRLDAIKR